MNLVNGPARYRSPCKGWVICSTPIQDSVLFLSHTRDSRIHILPTFKNIKFLCQARDITANKFQREFWTKGLKAREQKTSSRLKNPVKLNCHHCWPGQIYKKSSETINLLHHFFSSFYLPGSVRGPMTAPAVTPLLKAKKEKCIMVTVSITKRSMATLKWPV